jgi:hypothetical protein
VNSVSVKYRAPGHREDRREVAHDVRPADGPDRVGRFSDGLEQHRYAGQARRIGRFSDGLEQHRYEGQARRIGRFSDGLEQHRYEGQARRIGRFSDGLEQHRYEGQARRIGRFSDSLEQYPEQDRRQGDRIPLDADQPPVLVGEDQPGSATSEAA